jgi:pimeloyl-ACP methyl ester carboxylesterase
MATYALIHGAATDAWYWQPLADRLRARGHQVITPDLPCDDETAGLATYADTVVGAIGDVSDHTELIVVGHSFGGFTAPLVCRQLPVDLLVLLHAQIPSPGETPNQWWTATGYDVARRVRDELDTQAGRPTPDADVIAFALHDTPRHLAEELLTHAKDQAGKPFDEPWPLPAWPDTPTRVLLARDDRFFPADFLRRLTAERLGLAADDMPGDHHPMLGHPAELADRLETYRSLSWSSGVGSVRCIRTANSSPRRHICPSRPPPHGWTALQGLDVAPASGRGPGLR